MEKQTYEEPTLEIVIFETDDVIRTSDPLDDTELPRYRT